MKNIFKITQTSVLFLFILFGTNIGAQVTCSGGTTNIPRSGSVTVNGVIINTTYTGDVQNYPYGAWSSCSGSVTTSNNSLLVGAGSYYYPENPSPWSFTLNFNKPVNDLVIVLTATGTGGSSSNENFIFNSNGGTISITAGTNCYSTISGNQIISGAGAPIDYSGTSGGGGGLFKITAPSAYTQLTINGNGSLAGSLMAICGLSIKPACTAGTIAPPVTSLYYSCPESSINLATAHIGTIPSGTNLVWYKNNTHAGTALTASEIANAGAGTYYVFYYDSTNNCYSPASNVVTVSNLTTLDSDGDGVPDACDLDNDNDGILDTSECGSTDKLSNGIFPISGGNTNSLTGWTIGGTYAASGTWASPTGRINLNSNGLEFRRDASTVTTLSQNLTGVMSGATINISNVYWNKTQTNNATSRFTFTISYGGTIYATIDSTFGDTPTVVANNGATVNINVLPSVTAAPPTSAGILSAKSNLIITLPYNVANSGNLLFTFNAGSSSNNVRDLGMQSITLFSCKDTDGDGIPNYLDLDSDNDGCVDAIEGGGNFSSSQLVTTGGSLSVGVGSGASNQNLCAGASCVDVNGIPTIAGTSGQEIGYSDNANIKMCLDTDADGIPDVCDLDDDNDGILDVNENNCDSAVTKNIRIGYIPNSRSLASDNGYTFDGGYMSGSGALKLTDPSNFGPSGTVNANITLVAITANPITKADIDALNLNAIFIGGIDSPPTVSYLADSELSSIKDWSDDAASNVVVVTQTASKAWSSTITSGNINPDTPTSFGTGTPIFNGPFGTISSFSQGGSYQAYFATLNGACSTKKLAVDNSNRTVMYLDGIYNDLIIADVDILTTLGGVTSGSAITSNNDKLFGNIWAFVVSQSSCSDIDTDGDGIPNRLDLDSDNDGCLDALEGSQNITTSQLVNAGGTVTVGTGSTASNQNLCATTTCVDTNGVPTAVGSSGQGIGDSQNAAVQSGCFCYKPAVTSGTALDTKHGITALGRAGANNSNWPMVRKGAWTALESKEKGFVINRIPTTAEVEAISNPVEGMMVYDEEADCLKIYTTTDGTTFSWQCFNTQACPE
jgi:hypothetical protein